MTRVQIREVICIAEVGARGIEVVWSGVPRVVPKAIAESLQRECRDGDEVRVLVDELGQIVGIEHTVESP